MRAVRRSTPSVRHPWPMLTRRVYFTVTSARGIPLTDTLVLSEDEFRGRARRVVLVLAEASSLEIVVTFPRERERGASFIAINTAFRVLVSRPSRGNPRTCSPISRSGTDDTNGTLRPKPRPVPCSPLSLSPSLHAVRAGALKSPRRCTR